MKGFLTAGIWLQKAAPAAIALKAVKALTEVEEPLDLAAPAVEYARLAFEATRDHDLIFFPWCKKNPVSTCVRSE